MKVDFKMKVDFNLMDRENFNNSFILSFILKATLSLIIWGLFLTGFIHAQTPLTARPDRGFGAKGGYQTTQIDSISLQNGGVSLSVPLASLPPMAGGNLSYTLAATYNSKLFDIHRTEVRVPPGGPPGCPLSYSTSDIWPNEGSAGWRIGSTYQIFFRDANEDYDYIEPDSEQCFGYEWYHMQGRFFKPMLRMPDGSERELRLDGYLPQYPGQRDHLMGYFKYTGMPNQPVFTGPVRFYTIDGSFLTIIYRPEPDPVRWTIYFKDGTRVEATADGQRTIDPNGNSILQGARMVGSVYESFVKDEQTDREIKWSATTHNGQNATKVEYQSVGGTWQEVIVVWGSTTVRGKVYGKMGWNPNGGEFGQGDTCYHSEVMPEYWFPVVREIIYPATEQGVDPQKFTFSYSSDTTVQVSDNIRTDCLYANPPWDYTRNASIGWGEISGITTPTGANIEYSYVHDGTHTFSVMGEPEIPGQIKNFISTKSITHDGQTDTWIYSINDILPQSPSSGIVTNPDGSTYWEVYNPTDTAYGGFGGTNGLAGLMVRSYDSRGVRTERKWKLLGGTMGAYGSLTQQSSVNAVVEIEFTTLIAADGVTPQKMTAKKFEHDYNGEVTKVIEYDWFDPASVTYTGTGWQTMPADVPTSATILRVTETDYYNQAPNATSNNAYFKRVPDPSAIILGHAMEVRVGDGADVKSTSRFSFDGYAFGTPPVKGNLTKVSAYNDFTSTWIETNTTYTARGNIQSTTDANGNVTQVTYGSVGGYTDLYPTQTIAAYGTSIARTSSMQYDFSTGLPTLSTDVDNNISVVSEYDILGRITKVKNAVGTALESWTTTEYSDSNRRVIIRSDLGTLGDGRRVAVQHFDQLGRVRLSRKLENSAAEDPYNETHGIKVETRYQTGSPNSFQTTSNPFRAATSAQATNEPTMGWTRSKSWSHGRRQEIETFSGSDLPAPWGSNSTTTGVVSTDIDADGMLVTDQAGKRRISKTNALGQLKEVWEILAASEPGSESVSFPGTTIAHGFKTSYGYDTLSNLTTVNQGVQTRSFSYSSLSRLLSATNPESGTINYGYDPNGNLTTKTDARNITTSYVYDALNRVTGREYSDSTPDVEYTYKTTAPGHGNLIKVESSVSTTEYTSFDILGRVTGHRQTTDGQQYATGYIYNLSGALIEQTYPSGRVVKNVLGNNGDLSIVQSRKSPNHGYWNYAENFTYNAAGAVTSMQLGNGKWESTQFNSRLQPMQIALGVTQGATNLLKLDYSYGTTNNNGNVVSQTITAPTIGQNPGFTAVQNYTYDSHNRLKSAEEIIDSQTSWLQTFTFDRYGNRNFDESNTTTLPKNCLQGSTPVVCVADRKIVNPSITQSNNRLSTSDDYLFDGSGNTTADAQGRTFIYDAENKLDEVIENSVSIGKYFYDGDGKRIKKIADHETIVFVYDAAGKLIAEYANQVSQTPKVSYLTTDHLGSPRINTDENGTVTARHDYHPFGEEIARASYGGDDIRKKFATYERDTETGLDFAQARYFVSGVGRFSSPDPVLISVKRLVNPQIWNTYIYVGNNPLKFVDPLGLEKIQLGDSEEEIKRKKEAEKARKEALIAEKNALKKNKAARDEIRAKQKEIDGANRNLNNFDKQLEATRVVNRMLDALDEIGERNGLQLSDFTITTDPKNDFAGASAADLKAIQNSEAFVAQDGPNAPNRIYINTKISTGFYQQITNVIDPNAGLYVFKGAAILRHEQYHFVHGRAENPAWRKEREVFNKFKPKFTNNLQLYEALDNAIAAGIANNP